MAHFTIIVFATSEFEGCAAAAGDAAEVRWCASDSYRHLELTPGLEKAIRLAEQALKKGGLK